MNATSSGPAKLFLLSDTEVLITREFRAPRALVFDALTRPEHVRRWYGLRSMPMLVCEINLTLGGSWRYVLHHPDSGTDHAFSGEFREIVRPERIVTTERYEAIPGSDYLSTVTLTEKDGVTTTRSHLKYQNRMHRDGHLQSGMEPGMQETFNRLDELLESLQTN